MTSQTPEPTLLEFRAKHPFVPYQFALLCVTRVEDEFTTKERDYLKTVGATDLGCQEIPGKKKSDRSTLWRDVEVLSYPCPEQDGRVTIMVRLHPNDPTTLVQVETKNLRPLRVQCREHAPWIATPRAYPGGMTDPPGLYSEGHAQAGQVIQSRHYDINGDMEVSCPTCNLGYFRYNRGQDLDAMDKHDEFGWWSDRLLKFVPEEPKKRRGR